MGAVISSILSIPVLCLEGLPEVHLGQLGPPVEVLRQCHLPKQKFTCLLRWSGSSKIYRSVIGAGLFSL